MSGEGEKWKRLPQDHLARSTRLPWYHEKWSNVAPGDVVPHIYQVREQAWKFIEQCFLRHPDYSHILERITSVTPAPRFLDLGTCVGQDVRTLLHDGTSPSTIYGADLLPGFRDVGYALLKDSDRLGASHFVAGDIFSEVDELARTRGTWDIIHIAMFLHVFSLPDQETASKNILKLLKPGPGSTIIGTQTGSLDAGELKLPPPLCEEGEDRIIYRQSKETMKALFEKATEALGMNAVVWTEYDEDEVKERAAGRKEKGEEWEKRERLFAGDSERRIFFRVDIV
ncbi:hypothetical protein F4824DRAFT_516043 [Ustulina deusta]|nr:hypothetical protein F4824DRAFT_516043 [Ustulina deusta]